MKINVQGNDELQHEGISRPVLKWAGGKTQLLPQLLEVMPLEYNKYLEPFLGGGALFFRLEPKDAVVGDANAELINLYECLAKAPDQVHKILCELPRSSDDYYKVRSWTWDTLDPTVAAARTIYLNRLCFNGLYRVNKKGEFNVPYGNPTNPSMPTVDHLVRAGSVLAKAQIVKSDYLELLNQFASPGDFVFLDPPYIPVGQYSDFKRYNAQQFGDSDHEALAAEVRRLAHIGCYVVVTNSNHPVVHDLYEGFEIRVIETRRNISSKGNGRRGQDVIVIADGTGSRR